MGWSIIQTYSLFWWTGNQEEGYLRVYLPHWYISWCGCKSSWGPYHCLLLVMYWRGVHKILVIRSHVWESTCLQFRIVLTIQLWRPPVSWYHRGRFRRLCLILLVWWGFQNVCLIHHWRDNWFDHCFEVFCELRYFLIRILHFGLDCVLHDYELFIRLFIHIVASFYHV